MTTTDIKNVNMIKRRKIMLIPICLKCSRITISVYILLKKIVKISDVTVKLGHIKRFSYFSYIKLSMKKYFWSLQL